MSALLWALMWFVLLVVLVIIVVISLPVRLDARFNSQETPLLKMNVSVLGGLLPIPVKAGSPKGKPNQKSKKEKGKHRRNPRRFWPIFEAAPRLISSLFKSIKIETLYANLGYGFTDPADTGMAYGLLKPIEFWITRHEYARLTIDADFDKARLDGNGQFIVRMTPITLLPPIVSFTWTAFIMPKFRR